MKKTVCAALVLTALPRCADAETTLSGQKKAIETAGVAVSIAVPAIAAGITLYKHDRKGLLQLTAETALTVGTAFALKNIVRERRPDGSDWQSFPSDTTALSASGSSYLWGRYGWQYGLPAFAATQFVSWSRVQADQHHWYDTLASSAIAAGYALVVTSRFQERHHLHTELDATPEGGIIRVGYNF